MLALYINVFIWNMHHGHSMPFIITSKDSDKKKLHLLIVLGTQPGPHGLIFIQILGQ